MTHAEECRVRHLPDQIAATRRYLQALERRPLECSDYYWRLRRSRAQRKLAAYEARARELGAHWLLEGAQG